MADIKIPGSKVRTTIDLNLAEIELYVDELLGRLNVEYLNLVNQGLSPKQAKAQIVADITAGAGVYQNVRNRLNQVIKKQIKVATTIPYVVAGQDNPQQKFLWSLGDTIKHCSSCLAASQETEPKTYQEWANSEYGLPRIAGSSKLECSGYNCRCTLVPVD